MQLSQARRCADYVLWIGTDAIYVWNKKEGKQDRIPFSPPEEIPYVPNFHTLWEDTKAREVPYMTALTRLLGGRLRAKMSCILLAAPDDITWIERRALEDFALMAGAGAVNKRLFFCPQSVALRPPEEQFLAITWSCRCFTLCLVREGAVEKTYWLPLSQTSREALHSAVKRLESLPVYYPQIEPAPFPLDIGTGRSLGQLAALDG
ncbi:MAG: hypothetical protein HFE97_10825 [Oscillospiraceae bacterium]|nr:hypothetical protein [Oscillospiraceae bacterium]